MINNSDEFICSFKIGLPERKYSIYLVKEYEEVADVGKTDYQNAIITIKSLDNVIVQKTLLHELTHVWLYEMGHNQQDRQFSNEDICEILASSFYFITNVFVEFSKEYNRVLGKHSEK